MLLRIVTRQQSRRAATGSPSQHHDLQHVTKSIQLEPHDQQQLALSQLWHAACC